MYNLPEYPIGDVEFGDAESGDAEMGGMIDYGDVDEQGAPRRKRTTPHQVANRIATKTAKPGHHRVAKAMQHQRPDLAHKVQAHAAVRHMSKNHGMYYEAIKGGRFLSSDLGIDARLAPNEVDAVKSAIYLSTPFTPTVFSFTAGVLDIQQSLNSVIGLSTIYYAGLLIVLAASTLNLNQGAIINMKRNLSLVNAVTLSVNDVIELDSGVRAVEILVLNAQLIAGHARFWAPLIAGSVAAVPSTQITITGLPANYTATARFLQPGDAKVTDFLKML
jgi:hypothetical protein